MSNFLNHLVELSEAEEGMYMEFLLQYKFDQSSLHLFYEGYDDPSFYNGLINQVCPGRHYQYVGKGKYKLYSLYSDIDWTKYKKNRVLFFVDRDYTELIGESLLVEENVYTTDFYSIENHLVCVEVLERFFVEIFHVSNRQLLDEIVTKFQLEYNKFFRALWYLIAWIIFMKRSGEKIVLNDIDLSILLGFNGNVDIKAKGGKRTEYIEKVTGRQTPANAWKSISAVIREIRQSDSKLTIRGKFEAWFFVNFCSHYRDYLIAKGTAIKQKTHMTTANFVEICAPRFTMHESLRKFLENNVSRD